MVNQRVSLQLNINTADRESLMELPRIGPAMSKRIIAHREKNGYFKSFEDLLKVKGIGPATIQKLKPFIYF
ncbi:MAG: helix-hairpin-helix domain-containing protein [Candidatus Marinimicrobia bacterium]|nr:helix-hairpin-helix domain-containing protein [Candidatus Neomarinimicrobiota bacterium]MCF7827709.1 helix-hairpin-helix domain-containing protein [Candidatus Neomarinimicrobiota bacterium]MCF7881236.1 helix-hairpin-helix domain-containing protein [Candidatus Neomarinimicrobiota bacterium]